MRAASIPSILFVSVGTVRAPFGPRISGKCSGSEADSYLRLIDSCITQLKAQGPSRFVSVGTVRAPFPKLTRFPKLFGPKMSCHIPLGGLSQSIRSHECGVTLLVFTPTLTGVYTRQRPRARNLLSLSRLTRKPACQLEKIR